MTAFNTDSNPACGPIKAECSVCGDSINPADMLLQRDRNYRLCRNFICKNTMAKKADTNPDVFAAQLRQQRDQLQQQRRQQLDEEQRIESLNNRRHRENADTLDRVQASYPQLDKDTLIINIPTGHENLVATSSERLQSYQQHLEEVIEQALEYPDLTAVIYDPHRNDYNNRIESEAKLQPNSKLQENCDKLCAICKGGCCAHGNNKAYISAMTIRRQLDSEPDISGEEILQRYLSSANQNSMQNSCINHTEFGCALPREWRSDICNGYFCEPLKDLQEQSLLDSEDSTALIIRRAHHNWNQLEADACHDVVEVSLLDCDEINTVEDNRRF